MKKSNILWILLDLIFIIVFNIVIFTLVGVDKLAESWISYAFIHFAYLMVILTPILVSNGNRRDLDVFTIGGISSVYFFIELVIGSVFISQNLDSIGLPIIIQIILLGVYLIVLFGTMIANEDTAKKLDKQEEQVAFIKNASKRINSLKYRTTDAIAVKAIEKTYVLMHSSPSKTNSEKSDIENDILKELTGLELAASSNDVDEIQIICNRIDNLIIERNR